MSFDVRIKEVFVDSRMNATNTSPLKVTRILRSVQWYAAGQNCGFALSLAKSTQNQCTLLGCTSETTQRSIYIRMQHFCIKTNGFGVQGVSQAWDLCHFLA
jgi:hypothetical protein